jgi:hypothetical protein
MYKNDEYLKLTPEGMVHYIRKKHKKFEADLPGQLQKWVENQKVVRSDTKRYDKDTIELSDACKKQIDIDTKVKAMAMLSKMPISHVESMSTMILDPRLDIAVKLLCSINPGREDAASAVDYALDLTDELLKRIGE